MRKVDIFRAYLLFLIPTFGCAIEDSERCEDGYYYDEETNNCYPEQDAGADTDIDTDTDADTDTGTGDTDDDAGPEDLENWLGSACSCEGDDCDMFGVPLPAEGPISGCEQVPGDWTGALVVCLRSYTGDMAADSYFANGYCSLMASQCEGEEMICESGALGEYVDMVACPHNSVMISSSADLVMGSMEATVDSKYCAPSCENDDDCRTGETDPVFDGAATEYQCVFKDDVGFCFDPRNLSGDYSAVAF